MAKWKTIRFFGNGENEENLVFQQRGKWGRVGVLETGKMEKSWCSIKGENGEKVGVSTMVETGVSTMRKGDANIKEE